MSGTPAPDGPPDLDRAVASMLAAERHVALSHGDTRYFDVGTGPPLVLLHGVGYTAGGTNWVLNLEALAAGHRVLAPDLVGFGTGGRLAQPYSFAYLVDFVREFQDALDLGPVDLLGHSMGGWVATLFAYESPDRLRRLVLVAAGGLATRPLRSMTEFTPPSPADFDAALAARLGLPVGAVGALADVERRVAALPGALDAYRRLLAHMSDPETRERYATPRRLPHIAHPTLVVWGTGDEVNDIGLGREAAALLPHASMLELACGHAVPTQAPDDLARGVLDFLARAGTPPWLAPHDHSL